MKKMLIVALFPFLNWAQTQIGTNINGEVAGDQSGYSISMSADGKIVAIGSPYNDANGNASGHVRVFKNDSGTWTQIGKNIDGEASNDVSGYSLSLSADGSIVAIGAPMNNGINGKDSGHVRVYQNQSGIWKQLGSEINGESDNDQSGYSVSLSADGKTVAVGAIWNDGSDNFSGHVRVYKHTSGNWKQIGSDLNGEAIDDVFGSSVSLSADGNTVAIGSKYNDKNGKNSGHVRIFNFASGNWSQIGSDIRGEAAGDFSGGSVSLSAKGDVVAIGADSNKGNGKDAGHVRVFKNKGGTWTQIGTDIDGEIAGDLSGCSVSLSGDGSILAIGSFSNGTNGIRAGQVRVFKNLSDSWTKIGKNINGEAANNLFGYSVSLSKDGKALAVGSVYNSSNGDKSGNVKVFDLNSDLSNID